MTLPEEIMTAWNQRNPTELDFLRPNGFRLIIQRLPLVHYFCQTAAIPQMELGRAVQSTSINDIPWPGEKITFSPLAVRFAVQEDMSNYIELDHWIRGLGFPEDREQFAAMATEQERRIGIRNLRDKGQTSDIILQVYGSDNRPVVEVSFENCFPFSLALPLFSSQVSGESIEHLQADAMFAYSQFSLRKVRATA